MRNNFYYRSERTRWERTDHTSLKNFGYGALTFVSAFLLAICALNLGGF